MDNRCVRCGSQAFILFTSVECTNPACFHYTPKSARESVPVVALAERGSDVLRVGFRGGAQQPGDVGAPR